MKINQLKAFAFILFLIISSPKGQSESKTWTLEDCINYAVSNNIDIRKTNLNTQENEFNYKQSKANRLPSVNGSINHNFGWNKELNTETGSYESMTGSSNTNYGINASVTLFNGFKLNTQIEQARLNLESSKYYYETVKESIELSILNGYLQILYSLEEVNNAEEQIVSTTEQLMLAKERMDVGIISNSDYLQIKSQLASEKMTLANAKSTLTLAKVNLMQLMELPVTDSFFVDVPDISILLTNNKEPLVSEIYSQALNIKPQIKEASVNLERIELEEKIARADLLPSLSLSTGLSSGWSSGTNDFNYLEHLNNKLSPSVGLSLSIPIFQKKQVNTNIKLARVAVSSAKLDEIDTKNTLRKEIEQACADVITAQIQYEASLEQYEAVKESYLVVTEKYELGLINSVDFLIEKTNMITSESDLLQAKYNLIFSNKILDFYKGVPLILSN